MPIKRFTIRNLKTLMHFDGMQMRMCNKLKARANQAEEEKDTNKLRKKPITNCAQISKFKAKRASKGQF